MASNEIIKEYDNGTVRYVGVYDTHSQHLLRATVYHEDTPLYSVSTDMAKHGIDACALTLCNTVGDFNQMLAIRLHTKPIATRKALTDEMVKLMHKATGRAHSGRKHFFRLILWHSENLIGLHTGDLVLYQKDMFTGEYRLHSDLRTNAWGKDNSILEKQLDALITVLEKRPKKAITYSKVLAVSKEETEYVKSA